MSELLMLVEPFVWMLAGALGLWAAQRIARMASDIDPHATGPLIVTFDGRDANAHAIPVFEIENDFDDEAITLPVEVPNVTRRARGAR